MTLFSVVSRSESSTTPSESMAPLDGGHPAHNDLWDRAISRRGVLTGAGVAVAAVAGCDIVWPSPATAAEAFGPVSQLQGVGSGQPTPVNPIWEVQPTDTTKAPFRATLGGGALNGVWDYVFFLGYNAGDAKVVATEPVVEWVIEGSYNVGGRQFVECYWQFVSADGTFAFRPIGMLIPANPVPGVDSIGCAVAGDAFGVYHRDNLTPTAAFYGDSSGNGFEIYRLPGKQSGVNINGDGVVFNIYDCRTPGISFNISTDSNVPGGAAGSHLSSGAGAFLQMFQSVQIGTGGVDQAASDGWLYIPTLTGGTPPTATPRQYRLYSPVSGTPLAYDPAAHKLWAYEFGVGWKSVTLA